MPTARKFVVLALAALIAAPSSTFAQQRHVIDPATVAASVAQHAAEQDANRAAVREALTQPQVREMAGRMGLDVDRAAAAIDTLNASDLERAATAARQVNQQLVGGATTIVITTTTIIIALLIILIIVLAVD
jgi:hypothetical protein